MRLAVAGARDSGSRPLVAVYSAPDLDVLAGLADDGSLTPAIDRTYPLSAGREAMRHLGVEHARGKIVVVA